MGMIAKSCARVAAVVDMQDGFYFGGLLVVGYGVSLIYFPAGVIAVGLGLLFLGFGARK